MWGHHDVIGEPDHQHRCGDRPVERQSVVLRRDAELSPNPGADVVGHIVKVSIQSPGASSFNVFGENPSSRRGLAS
jgi:hypothetical protein